MLTVLCPNLWFSFSVVISMTCFDWWGVKEFWMCDSSGGDPVRLKGCWNPRTNWHYHLLFCTEVPRRMQNWSTSLPLLRTEHYRGCPFKNLEQVRIKLLWCAYCQESYPTISASSQLIRLHFPFHLLLFSLSLSDSKIFFTTTVPSFLPRVTPAVTETFTCNLNNSVSPSLWPLQLTSSCGDPQWLARR